MKNVTFGLIILLLAGFLMSACQPVQLVEPTSDQRGEAYGQTALVESLEIRTIVTTPPQARVIVSGYLPDSCTELYRIVAERADQDFVLVLTTRWPTGEIVCSEVLVPFTEVIDLDLVDLDPGTYAVIAQNEEVEFIWKIDKSIFQPIKKVDDRNRGNAVVQALMVDVMESFPVQVSVTVEGYLPDGCTTIDEISSSRQDQIFTINLSASRPSGNVVCTMAIVPFRERIDLDVQGLLAGEYIVRYAGFSETFILDVDNESP